MDSGVFGTRFRGLSLGIAAIVPLLAGIVAPSPTSFGVEAFVGAEYALRFSTPASGVHYFWVQGTDEEIALLSDGRSVLLQSVTVGGRAWRVSPPLLLGEHDQTLLLSETENARGFILSRVWGWPVAGPSSQITLFTDDPDGLDPRLARAPALVTLIPRSLARVHRVRLRGPDAAIEVEFTGEEWRLEHADARIRAPAHSNRWLSRWILRRAGRSPRLDVELARNGVRVYAEHRLLYEAAGSFYVESAPGMRVHGIVPGQHLLEELGASEAGPGWGRVRLLGPSDDEDALLRLFFASSTFDLRSDLFRSSDLVLGYEYAASYATLRCLGQQLVFRVVRDGQSQRAVPVPGGCQSVRIRKRPGNLVVNGRLLDQAARVADIGGIGCLLQDGRACRFEVEDLSAAPSVMSQESVTYLAEPE